MATPTLEVRNITKRFPGVLANDDINFTLHKGQIHCMLGENGAGKTTLMNIIYGLYQPDSGEIWVDGQYFTYIVADPDWTLAVAPSQTGEVSHRNAPITNEQTSTELVLQLPENTHADPRLRLLDLSIDTGSRAAFLVDNTDRRLDVRLSRWLGQAKDPVSFYDPYYRRSAWDGVPENVILSVPARHYHTARVLCAVDPDLSPTMGVRIGRYRQKWDGSGMSQGDTNVRVDPKNPQGLRSIEQRGTTIINTNNRKTEMPVYEIAVPLQTGAIADYLQWQGLSDGSNDWGEPLDSLILEFTRTMHTRVQVSSAIFERKPLGAESGVHILGVVLESSPVDIQITSDEPGYAFYTDTNPLLHIRTIASTTAPIEPWELIVQVTDYDGNTNIVRRPFRVSPGRTTTEYPLTEFGPGWYNAQFTFCDDRGKTMWQQPVTFALLPPDTRKAGNESPFGTWWFEGAHYTEPHTDRVLPIVQKMGFRHLTPPTFNRKRNAQLGTTAENWRRYGITPSMFKVRGKGIKWDQPDDVVRDALGKEITEAVTGWPGIQYAMIFHETGIKGLDLELPPELTGAEPFALPEIDGGGRARVEALKQQAKVIAAAYRKYAPAVKIILGNGGLNFNVFWFREKLSREVWDCSGMEMAIQSFHPEGQPTGWNLQSLWLAKRMRELYRYDDMPITSCYEFDYRETGPGGLTLERQADWYARDVLHCLAYRMPSINVALVADCNSSYYTSRWGSTGVCFRSPQHMPKPSFVTLATLTRVLDRAEYVRWIDTGSTGAYCLEFKRGNEHVYALWTGRGTRSATLTFAGPATNTRFENGMGRAVEPTGNTPGTIVVTVAETPAYLTVRGQIKTVQLGGPQYTNPKLSASAVIEPVADPTMWRTVRENDPVFANYCAYKPMIRGQVTLSPGTDDSVRLTLQPDLDTAAIIGRYTVLEPLTGPVSMPGTPNVVGVWVNGNSNWGRVYFEFEDADGRRWTSNGWEEASGSWDMSDWEADTAINHDGWRFVYQRLPGQYPGGYYTPATRHWRCQGNNSKTITPTYPLEFARLYVVMREQLVYVTDMVPAKNLSIELRNLTVGTLD